MHLALRWEQSLAMTSIQCTTSSGLGLFALCGCMQIAKEPMHMAHTQREIAKILPACNLLARLDSRGMHTIATPALHAPISVSILFHVHQKLAARLRWNDWEGTFIHILHPVIPRSGKLSHINHINSMISHWNIRKPTQLSLCQRHHINSFCSTNPDLEGTTETCPLSFAKRAMYCRNPIRTNTHTHTHTHTQHTHTHACMYAIHACMHALLHSTALSQIALCV
jgi:hypothetical protein